MKKTSIFLAVLSASSVLALAADETPAAPAKPKADPAKMLKLFDRNSDGAVTLDEYEAGMKGNMDPARVPAVFKQKDKDGDGKLNADELMIIPPKAAPKVPAKAEKKP